MTRSALPVLVLVLLMTCPVYAGETDRIAVAAEGRAVTADVSPVAARGPYFLIFDGDGRLLETVENPYRSARRKAGVNVVPFLARKGVTMVVAGQFGKNMTEGMKEREIQSLAFTGNVETALEKVLEAGK